jgi:O-methyltransferase
VTDLADDYLDLLMKVITRYGFDPPVRAPVQRSRLRKPLKAINRALAPAHLAVLRSVPTSLDARATGRDHPWLAESMVGLRRLENVKDCVRTVIEEAVPGDLVETGVWRGGTVIFMRACLRAFGDDDRIVWAADSFEGLPPPSGRHPEDTGDLLHTWEHLAVSLEEVQANFERYGLLDSRVRFRKGWFSDTLPTAPIEQIAVLRLDGDMYESTMDALVNLFPKVSAGGFVIVDDYGTIPACKQAVHDYRDGLNITSEIIDIDGYGAFWRVERDH